MLEVWTASWRRKCSLRLVTFEQSGLLSNSAVSAAILKIAYGDKIYKEHGRDLAELNMENMRHTGPIFTTFYAVVAFPWRMLVLLILICILTLLITSPSYSCLVSWGWLPRGGS
jgi:hypothetical protein